MGGVPRLTHYSIIPGPGCWPPVRCAPPPALSRYKSSTTAAVPRTGCVADVDSLTSGLPPIRPSPVTTTGWPEQLRLARCGWLHLQIGSWQSSLARVHMFTRHRIFRPTAQKMSGLALI